MIPVSSIITLVLLFLPLVCLPFVPFGFETPKVLVFELVVIAVFFYLLFCNRLRITKALLIGCVGVSVLSVITVFFFNSPTVWFNNPIRLQGLFLQLILMGWIVVSGSKEQQVFSKIFSLATFSAVSVSGFFLQHPQTQRAIGSLGEPNSYAGIAVLLGVIATFAWKENKYAKFVYYYVLFFSFLAVIISGSRSGLLALALGVLLFVLWFKKNQAKKITIIGTCFLLSSLLFPFFSATNSWEDRSMIWRTAVVAGFSSPMVGHGFGNVTFALKESSVTLQNHIRFQFVDSSHNILLDWWVQGGLLGLITFLYFVGFSVREFIKQQMIRELILLFTSLMIMMFNPVSIAILAIFWWCVGRGFCENDNRRIIKGSS